MNPNIQRHHFVHCTEDNQRLLPDYSLFTAGRGERCVPLTACWTELLSDCADLGPVAIVSQSAGAQLAHCVSSVEFVPVPLGSEIVELGSSFVVDTAEWSHALAVEEPVSGGCLFSLQFFGRDGHGLWKLLLTRAAHLEQFGAMVRHYASGTPPPTEFPEAACKPDQRPVFQSRGCVAAHEVSFEVLTNMLIESRRQDRPLRVTVGRGNLTLSAALIPRCLERCACTLHAYDYDTEFHLAVGENYSIWRVHDRSGWSLQILDPSGSPAATLA